MRIMEQNTFPKEIEYLSIYLSIYLRPFISAWFILVRFYGTTTFIGYLMPNPFYASKQLYFKQFSLP